MGNAIKKLEKALIKKSFQDGVIQGIRVLSNSIFEKQIIDDPSLLNSLTDCTIREVTKRFKDLEESKQPEFIFTENREAYVKYITDRNWRQEDYIYLRDPEQIAGYMSPVVHYAGNYSNNPKYDAVRKMERARTFKNKGE